MRIVALHKFKTKRVIVTMVNSVFIASLTYAKADESCFKEAHVSYSAITTLNEKNRFYIRSIKTTITLG